MIITRRAFTAALSLTGLAALAGFSPLRLITAAMAQDAAEVAKPVSLPDMALGPANAAVTITEYASMTCPHCAAFTENVFPKIKSEYIDTGKVRYVFREFPLDIKAAAGSMLARCIAKDDSGKYFAVVDMLFKQQSEWVMDEHRGNPDPDRQAGRPEPAGRSRIASRTRRCSTRSRPTRSTPAKC